nr:hypothetical protein - human adenovirus 12 [Human adenovirus 12]
MSTLAPRLLIWVHLCKLYVLWELRNLYLEVNFLCCWLLICMILYNWH